EAVPSPALKTPTRQEPAQTAAIRTRRVSMPASTPSATWIDGGQSRSPPFSQSTTASSVTRSAEPAAGGTARVSDWTRGGGSGLPGGRRRLRGAGAVARRDHPGPGGRVPGRVAAESGVTAAMADDPAQDGVLVDEQPEAVGGRGRRGAVSGEAGRDGPAG